MATKQLFTNDASSLLAASITDTETTIQVDAGFGALYPNPGATEHFVIALENAAGELEICKVTARSADLFTVVRGWEGTTAQAWTNGVTRVEMRNTAGSMRQMIQRSGDTMEGDLNMDGYEILEAVLDEPTVNGGTLVGTVVRGSDNSTVNQFEVPSGGGDPTIGGSPILTNANFDPSSVFEPGSVIMWYGVTSDIPSGWALCDGNNGRPDLRDRFVVGAGNTYAVGTSGGASSVAAGVTGSGGDHNHTGTTGDTTLTEAQIPAHNHRLWAKDSTDTDSDVAGFRLSTVSIAGDRNSDGGYVDVNAEGVQLVEDAGSGSTGHNHTIGSSGSHTHTTPAISTLPPYYGLYFIIKVDPSGDYGGVGGGGGGGGGSGSMYDMYNEDGCTTYIGGRSTLMEDVDGAANIQINCCASNVFNVKLTQNATILEPNNPISGQVINIILKQKGAGGWTVTWNSVFKFPGGTDPTITATAGAKDIVSCQYDSDDRVWYCNHNANYA